MTCKAQKLFKRAGALLLILTLLLSMACVHAEEAREQEDEVSVLPLDFSAGMPLERQYFKGGWQYEDPTISVSVTRHTASLTNGNCPYWVASVKIKHASQLRTMAANRYDATGETYGDKIAKRVNAVLAISGDTYSYTGHGLIIRQGVKFLDALQGDRDVLLVDEDGDFHVVRMANRGDIGDTINGKKVIDSFFFGPALVVDGQPMWYMEQKDDMKADAGRQRICIAQVGPLEYKCICCGPPENGSCGMTIAEFTKLVASLGVQTAYNLDGGYTTKMYFNAELVNNVSSQDRKITDIIYFASALGADSSAASQYETRNETEIEHESKRRLTRGE